MYSEQLIVRHLGQQPYEPVWRAMTAFTDQRNDQTIDEFWLVQHPPVFTQGQAGKPEHILAAGDIPIVQVDRGGQVTYHGPGQQIIYLLLNIRRMGIGVRELVTRIEQSIIDTLAELDIPAHTLAGAPGVYVGNAKIAALGLRIRKGCSFHGLALNIAMDTTPFQRINPCGYAGMAVTQIGDFVTTPDMVTISDRLVNLLSAQMGYKEIIHQDSGHDGDTVWSLQSGEPVQENSN